MLAVPFVPELTFTSLETETDVTGAKNTIALKLGGGFVTLIDPGELQPAKGPFRQKLSTTEDAPVPVKVPLKSKCKSVIPGPAIVNAIWDS